MKKNFGLLLLLLGLLIGCSSDDSSSDPQPIPDDGPGFEVTTAITDPVFEQALIDLGLDDDLDGTVVTSNIEEITELILNDLGITDLSGIQDFGELETLIVDDNNLTRLDVFQNTKLKFVFAKNNALTFINVQNLSILEKIEAQNNSLSSMDVLTNPALQLLLLTNNDVTALDVSNNSQLNTLAVEDNPLTCIRVSQNQLDNIPMNWTKDAEDSYALDCE